MTSLYRCRLLIIPVRNINWLPKYRKVRANRVIKIPLPDYEEMYLGKQKPDKKTGKTKSLQEMRREHIKSGGASGSRYLTKPVNIFESGMVLNEFVPPDDESSSPLTDKVTSMVGSPFFTKYKRNLAKFERSLEEYCDEKFNKDDFLELCQSLYVEANDLLQDFSEHEDRLHEIITENAYKKMTQGLKFKTLRWKFIESVQPPRIVNTAVEELISPENMFAQVTVRFYSKQTLALYDRFGRLMYGNENIIKDVIEYVVFERALCDEYGTWKVHDKILAKENRLSDSVLRTVRLPETATASRESHQAEDDDFDMMKHNKRYAQRSFLDRFFGYSQRTGRSSGGKRTRDKSYT